MTGESGKLADAGKIINRIQHELEKADVNADHGADPRALKWDDPDHRRMIREKFQEDGAGESILPGFGESGHGENAREDCGDPHPFVCDSCGHSVDFGRTCSQSVCTRCAVAWCRDLAINKSAKIRRVRKEQYQAMPSNVFLHHQIISPPAGWYYDLAKAGYSIEEAQEVTKSVVKDVLDEMRGQGLLVRHSFRGADDDGSVLEESDDRGEWKKRLNSDRPWFGDVRDELAWKPHYHCIVVGDWLEGGDLVTRIEKATGWVIHRISDDDGKSLDSDGAMARAVTYALSHADVQVRPDAHNRSAVWEVGSFEGDPIKSSGRFSARPADLQWADSVVRDAARKILGLRSGTTDCGAILPAVDDPDELARRIIEELYPQDDRPAGGVDPDVVLYHVAEGNISVDVSTTSGGGGDVTVRDAWGMPVGSEGWGSSSIPLPPASGTYDGADQPLPISTTTDDVQDDDECGCGGDHDSSSSRDEDEQCSGSLIPLGTARERGLLDDDEWCREAPHVDEAREADREWPEDLEPWRTSSPGSSIAVG